MFLRPDLPIIRRLDGSVQVGTDWPGIAIFAQADATLEEFLHEAASGVALEQIAVALPAATRAAVISQLEQRQLLITQRHLRGQDRCWQRVDEHLVGVWGDHAVAFDGLAALGLRCAQVLIDTGLCALRLHDNERVRESDLGVYPAAALQYRRSNAAAEVLRERQQFEYVPARFTQLTLVTAPWLIPLPQLNEYLALDQPYLAITWSETEVQVGPLYRPGVTACARCAFVQRSQEDPSYPLVMQQAATSGEPRCEATLQLRAAAFVAQVTQRFLAGCATPADNACWHFSQADPIARFEQIQPNAQCGCFELHDEQAS